MRDSTVTLIDGEATYWLSNRKQFLFERSLLSLDIETTTLANIKFNNGHAEIHHNIYPQLKSGILF